MTPTVSTTFPLSSDQTELVNKAIQYERASLALNTRRTYAVMWKKFYTWCEEQQLGSLPASVETVSLYLSHLGGEVSFSTLDCVIAAIEKVHEQKGMSIQGDPNLYRRIRKGIRRTHKESQTLDQAKALSIIDLTLVCRQLGNSLKDLRDKALITVGFFGALRRSEAIALDVEHLEFNDKGVILTLLQTKTSDQAVRVYLTYTKDVTICPVKALKRWLCASQITSGPVFCSLIKGNKASYKRLSGRFVAKIMNYQFGKDYSGHSLRRGLVTSVAEKGIALPKIQQLSRHKTLNMVLKYIEHVEGFENASTINLGA